MELNTYRLNSLEEPTDAQLHALMEQVAMSARESSRHAELELKHRMQVAEKKLSILYQEEKQADYQLHFDCSYSFLHELRYSDHL